MIATMSNGFRGQTGKTVTSIYPKVKQRFPMKNMIVDTSLLGRKQSFSFEGKAIVVRLPTKKEIEEECKNEMFRIGEHCGGSKYSGESEWVDHYAIYMVHLFVTMKNKMDIPDTLPSGIKRPWDILHQDEQTHIHKELHECTRIGARAYAYWLRCLRWSSCNALLGREAADNFANYGGRAIDPRNEKSLGFGFGGRLVVGGLSLKLPDWQVTGRRIRRGIRPPVWIDWFLEGNFSEASGNEGGALANYAIACESFLLSRFFSEVPRAKNQDVSDILARRVSGRDLINKFAKKRFLEITDKEWSVIHKLFDIRNELVHGGTIAPVSKAERDEIVKVLGKLLYSWMPRKSHPNTGTM